MGFPHSEETLKSGSISPAWAWTKLSSLTPSLQHSSNKRSRIHSETVELPFAGDQMESSVKRLHQAKTNEQKNVLTLWYLLNIGSSIHLTCTNTWAVLVKNMLDDCCCDRHHDYCC